MNRRKISAIGGLVAALLLSTLCHSSALAQPRIDGRDLLRDTLREVNEGLPWVGELLHGAVDRPSNGTITTRVFPYYCGSPSQVDVEWLRVRPQVLNVVTLGRNVSGGYRFNLQFHRSTKGTFVNPPLRSPGGFRIFACAFESIDSYPLNQLFVQLTSDRGGHKRVVSFDRMNPHKFDERFTPPILDMHLPGNWRIVSITNQQLGGWGTNSFVNQANVYAVGDNTGVPRTVRFGTFYIRHQDARSPGLFDIGTNNISCEEAFRY